MLQEDSNGENTFEIIDKKHEESGNDKTESISSVSSPYSIPSPGGIGLPGGNLLSNLPPPSTLPDFMIVPSTGVAATPSPLPPSLVTQSQYHGPTMIPTVPPITQPFVPTQFSAAIPPSKGIQHGSIPPQQNLAPDSNQNAGGLISWMKDAVSSGGILSKVAEKAKNSVDSLITTLDPQMSEFIYSGGDIEIAVVTQDPEEFAPIRDAIYAVFGKAWVNDLNLKSAEYKFQAIGYEDGIKRAEEKLSVAMQSNKIPTVSVENILLEQTDNYFDLSVLLLKDKEKQITLRTYTQTTPIPVDVFTKEAEKEIPGVSKICESTDKLLATYLQTCKNEWQQNIGGVSRREMLFLAAKVLFTLYKNKIVTN